MNFIRLLKSRFLLKDSMETCESFTNKGVYCGFDPTAASLHLGHLCTLNSLVYASSLGYTPIVILGTATAQIGDPSGKTESRQLITKEAVFSNCKAISSQVSEVFGRLQTRAKSSGQGLRIIENGIFYEKLELIEFLREVGLYFPINPLLNRDFIENRSSGVSFTEFSYSLLQAYDFYMLCKHHSCVGQVGGSDQWSNITSGTELIRKKLNTHTFGCTIPLLTTKDGKKFGKTEGNALFLDKNKTKPYDIYQYCYNLPDDEIEKLLYRLTFLSESNIKEAMNQPVHLRTGQKLLAFEIIASIHSEKDANDTQRLSDLLFQERYDEVFGI